MERQTAKGGPDESGFTFHFNRQRATNRQIRNVFGESSYGAANAYERFRMEIQGNRKLRKEIERIKQILSNVKP